MEIYQHPLLEDVSITWDQDYAAGGFSQVNQDMNHKLVNGLAKLANDLDIKSVLDLFGGNGNLSQKMLDQNVHVVDTYPHKISSEHQSFHQLSLEDNVYSQIRNDFLSDQAPDLMIVDPPRRGFKQISTAIDELRPKFLLYISCHPASMLRDLKQISEQIEPIKWEVWDLFPGTFHFEALTLLKLK